jgi:hypothetical protein
MAGVPASARAVGSSLASSPKANATAGIVTIFGAVAGAHGGIFG